MRTSILLLALAIFLSQCTSESLNVAPELTTNYQFSTIDLNEGVSKWLPEEAKTRFSEAELIELDNLLAYGTLPDELESRTVVELPADSEDALADAIAEAGEGGTVILKAGNHFESQTVLINQRVFIQGEEGAFLISDVLPAEQVGFVQPALHISDADNVVVRGITFQPSASVGGSAILIDNAERTFLVRNTINDFQFGILVEQGDFARIVNNKINTTLAWTTGDINIAHGLIIANGDQTRVIGNQITSSFFGAWTCDKSGLYLGNTTTGNYVGNILCTVPPALPLADGRIVASETPAENWLTFYNRSTQSITAGFLVIDGANNNYLAGNEASENGAYDYELAGDSERFGYPTPMSFENRLVARTGQTVKDCGEENEVIGGVLVDTGDDFCN